MSGIIAPTLHAVWTEQQSFPSGDGNRVCETIPGISPTAESTVSIRLYRYKMPNFLDFYRFSVNSGAIPSRRAASEIIACVSGYFRPQLSDFEDQGF
jgi:hypothetical protein